MKADQSWLKRLAFSVFGIENLPTEMREGMTAGGTLAPRISRAEALQVPAVLRGRNLIAGTLAGLPVHLRDPIAGNGRLGCTHDPVDQIDPDVPNIITSRTPTKT